MVGENSKSKIINKDATVNSTFLSYKKKMINKASVEIQKVEKEIEELEQIGNK